MAMSKMCINTNTKYGNEVLTTVSKPDDAASIHYAFWLCLCIKVPQL